MNWRGPFFALLAAGTLAADTSPPRMGDSEMRWAKGAWQFASNDPLVVAQDSGDVLAIQISGRGESCAIRRRLFRLAPPCRVIFRIRWTEAPLGAAYPSVHLLLDPPALSDPWWKKPIEGGSWEGGRRAFIFHFATDDNWKRVGMCTDVEDAPQRHTYSSPKDRWVRVQLTLAKDSITVAVDGRQVARCEVDLSDVRTFAPGFGDQTSTRVELDEMQVLPGK